MAVSILNTDADLAGNTLITEENAYTITGLHTYDRDPSAPYAVTAGSAVVTNLDADLLDGQHLTSVLRSDAADIKTSGDLTFNDSVAITFGTGGDVDLEYDGTDLLLNLTVVGAGDFVITGGSVEFSDSEGVTLGTGKDATFQYDGTDVILNTRAVGSGDLHVTGGNIIIPSDSVGLVLGAGEDATIVYDGTNLVIEPRAVGSGHLVINDACMILLNETTNANMTVGVTIDQAGNDNQAFCLKSSGDVDHGITSLTVLGSETDSYVAMGKVNANEGGLQLEAYCEDAAVARVLQLEAFGGTANTTKTTSGSGLVDIYVTEHNGSNALANITANGNIFSVTARVGGANLARFILDEDGDIFTVSVTDVTGSGNAVTGTAFDKENDAELLRTFDRSRFAKGLIRSKWDQFVRYEEKDLVRTGILGAPIAEGGMWNLTQHTRLLTGGVWQNYVRGRALEEQNARLAKQNRQLDRRVLRLERLLKAA